MAFSNLQKQWQNAASELRLDVIIPFTLKLDNGGFITAEVLLVGYGAKHGMIIVSDYDVIRKHVEFINLMGYGFSCMSQPKETGIDSIDGFNDLLDDWGVSV
jgi:hypothetical protein